MTHVMPLRCWRFTARYTRCGVVGWAMTGQEKGV